MTAIGVDTHKATLAACAVDELGRAIGEETFANDPAGHLAFIAWARAIAPEGMVGVEGSSSFGAPLARAVQAAGLCVREVPPHLSRFERRRTRRPGKSDPGDALAIARVTARETNLPPIRVPDRTSEIRLLLEAREDLIGETSRARNRLHAHLRILVPGYGGTVANLVAARHQAMVRRLLRGNAALQAELARSLLDRLPRLERECAVLTHRIEALVEGHPLLALPGAGPITVARLIGEAGDMRRFRTPDAFAALAGVASDTSELGAGPADASQSGWKPPAESGPARDRGDSSPLPSSRQGVCHPPHGGRREDLARGDSGPQAPVGAAGLQAPRRGL